jgi:hypothetical protein
LVAVERLRAFSNPIMVSLKIFYFFDLSYQASKFQKRSNLLPSEIKFLLLNPWLKALNESDLPCILLKNSKARPSR